MSRVLTYLQLTFPSLLCLVIHLPQGVPPIKAELGWLLPPYFVLLWVLLLCLRCKAEMACDMTDLGATAIACDAACSEKITELARLYAA